MTDKEIIKALECCKMPVGSGACNGCPLKTVRDSLRKEDTKSCTTILLENALDLIKRQKAEIERLQKLQKPTETSGFIVEDNRIVFYTNILNGYRHEYITINEIARELNGLLHAAYKKDEVLSHYKGKLETAKSEAVKEFAERLKKNVDGDINRIYAMGGIGGAVAPLCKFKDDVDNLVKEMTE